MLGAKVLGQLAEPPLAAVELGDELPSVVNGEIPSAVIGHFCPFLS